MKNSKEWFSVSELLTEQIEGLPTTDKGISKKADREKWEKRQRNGVKGKTFEYHYTSFPENVQQALGFTPNTKVTDEPKQQFSAVKNVESEEKVPFYNAFASAGFGAINTDVYKPDDYIGLSQQWLTQRGLNRNGLMFIMASGDSMYPTINDGDMLLINRNATTPRDGKIYVVRSGEQLWVKRVQGIINGIRLISDNKAIYSPIDVYFDESLDFEVIGQVVFIGRDTI